MTVCLTATLGLQFNLHAQRTVKDEKFERNLKLGKGNDSEYETYTLSDN